MWDERVSAPEICQSQLSKSISSLQIQEMRETVHVPVSFWIKQYTLLFTYWNENENIGKSIS